MFATVRPFRWRLWTSALTVIVVVAAGLAMLTVSHGLTLRMLSQAVSALMWGLAALGTLRLGVEESDVVRRRVAPIRHVLLAGAIVGAGRRDAAFSRRPGASDGPDDAGQCRRDVRASAARGPREQPDDDAQDSSS